MNKISKIILAVALVMLTSVAKAQDKRNMFNPINTSVTSQTIAPDARAAGMGDVGVATDPDVVSQYWNPAKYPFTISRAGVALNYTPWLRELVNDMDLAYLAGYYRIGDYSAVSASLRYFSLGEVFLGTSDDAMTINPYEMSLDVAYSLMLSEKFSLAAAIRWIYSDMRFDYKEDNSPASAFAADIAAYYQNYVVIGQRECQLGIRRNGLRDDSVIDRIEQLFLCIIIICRLHSQGQTGEDSYYDYSESLIHIMFIFYIIYLITISFWVFDA